jgi:hypothetical protein
MNCKALVNVYSGSILSVFYDFSENTAYDPELTSMAHGVIKADGQLNVDSREFTPDLSGEELVSAYENQEIDKLYNQAISYQTGENGIDVNTDRELSRAQSLLEGGQATEADLPKAAELGAWLSDTLWGDPVENTGWYYKGKSVISTGEIYTEDISKVVGKAPWDFRDLKEERLAFLAQ